MRMATEVAAQAQPVFGLPVADVPMADTQLGETPTPLQTVIRGDVTGQNFGTTTWNIQQAFESALRWKVSGNTAYADQAVNFLMPGALTNTTLTGHADRFLASGLYAFDWAATAEIMDRTYSGWSSAGITQFQNYLLDVDHPLEESFLWGYEGGLPQRAYPTNYWAKWGPVQRRRHDGDRYFLRPPRPLPAGDELSLQRLGQGTLDNVEYYLFSGNLGQDQESVRDQGHTLLEMEMLGDICQMAW